MSKPSGDDIKAPAGKHVVTIEKRGRQLHLRCFDENGKELKLGAGVRENIIDKDFAFGRVRPWKR